MFALVFLACVPGPLWVNGGAWWPECRRPVQWGRQVMLNGVLVVVGVCVLRVATWHR